jgi:hypothetical protein
MKRMNDYHYILAYNGMLTQENQSINIAAALKTCKKRQERAIVFL